MATRAEETPAETKGYFPRWTLKDAGVIAPEERLPWGQTIFLGLQHVLAMFGATVLAPIIMGFNPNTAIFFSGIGTLVFFLLVGGRIPSYLGSSFSFIAVVLAATAFHGTGPNPNIAVALGGIIACGAVYALIGLVVMLVGYRWIDVVMPPVVTGAIVAVIGLNLAPVAVSDVTGAGTSSGFNITIAVLTILATGLIAIYAPGALKRLPILLGGVIGYVLYLIGANGFGWGKAIDFSGIAKTSWIGLPSFTTPTFQGNAILLIAPVAVVLVAENLGHVKAVAAMTGQNLDKYLGRAFLGDGLSTIIAGFGGGTGVTTYAENIGVMAVTRIYSSLIFVVAAIVALLLGFCPKFGALIQTLPGGVLGGLAIILFGLIAATGARIWIQNKVDFSKSRNLIPAAVALTIGAGNFQITLGNFTLSAIGVATVAVIVLYHILREKETEEQAVETGPEA